MRRLQFPFAIYTFAFCSESSASVERHKTRNDRIDAWLDWHLSGFAALRVRQIEALRPLLMLLPLPAVSATYNHSCSLTAVDMLVGAFIWHGRTSAVKLMCTFGLWETKKVSVINCNSSHENLYIFKFTRAKSVALTALVSELQLLQQLTDPNSRYEERCVISSLNRWYFYEICDCGTKWGVN